MFVREVCVMKNIHIHILFNIHLSNHLYISPPSPPLNLPSAKFQKNCNLYVDFPMWCLLLAKNDYFNAIFQLRDHKRKKLLRFSHTFGEY